MAYYDILDRIYKSIWIQIRGSGYSVHVFGEFSKVENMCWA